MKTRIISGAVLIAAVIAVLSIGSALSVVLVAFIGLLSAIACYEMIANIGTLKKKAFIIAAILFAIAMAFANGGYTAKLWQGLDSQFLSVIYIAVVAVLCVVYHKDITVTSLALCIGMPIVISYAFWCIAALYFKENGLFYLLLLLNFSSICDCGAYFTGVTIGKHKLCPEVSPKKTVEGAVGGIVWSLIVSLILYFTLGNSVNLALLIVFTVAFCILGMFGDLFASVIKRSVGIKDYGNLIPGHGGILDRFDSILLIAPVLLLVVDRGLM